jgi:hypothetical protein
VTVSIGVGFAITRTFGVAWSWVHLGGGKWAFNLDAFMNEMLPLVVIVPVMSLVSYFLITGAVRKYKAYLDSGLDYKNLVKSVRRIDDLQEDRIKSLGDYPELRDSLLKLRQRVADREAALDEREAGIGATNEEVEAIKAELNVLTGAINRGPEEGFTEELAVTTPELKRIEKAIREKFLIFGTPVAMNDLGEQMAHIRLELVETATALKNMLGELSAELIVSQNGTKEIELYLSQLRTIIGSDAGQADPGTVQQATAVINRLDQTSAALAALGEETKSIAINAALHAGQGEGGLSDLVKLADDVRDVAGRFNGISAQYVETGQQVRAAVKSLGGHAGDGQLTETMETMSDRVKYWAERVMILGDKFNAFELNFKEMVTTFDAKLGGGETGEAYQTVDDFTAGTDDERDLQGDQAPSGGTPEEEGIADAAGAAIPGLERNKNLFEEIGGESDDNLFADIPDQDEEEEATGGKTHTGLTGVFERNDLHSPLAEEKAEVPTQEAPQAGVPDSTGQPSATQTPAPAAPPADAPPAEQFEEIGTEPTQEDQAPAAPTDQPRTEPGEFVQSQVDLSGKGKEIPPIPGFDEYPAPTGDPAASPGATAPEQDAPDTPAAGKVYDLYELGAVDYEPTVHHSA